MPLVSRLTSSTGWLRRAGLGAALLASLGLGACVVAPPRHPGYGRPAAPMVQPAPAAQEPMYFYPERSQGEMQQDRDRYECYRWAVRETGIDPGMQPVRRSATPVPAPVPRDPGPAVAGAATGAIIGGAVSSPRNAGVGMVLGAIFGGAMGAAAEENRAQATERAQEARRRDWEARQAPVNDFRRAMSACMSGRGYVVR